MLINIGDGDESDSFFSVAGIWAKTISLAAGLNEVTKAHLKTIWEGSDIGLMWIRRARKDGYRCGAGEPLFEGGEGYRVRVSGAGSVRE